MLFAVKFFNAEVTKPPDSQYFFTIFVYVYYLLYVSLQ